MATNNINDNITPSARSGSALAYLGDAVLEVQVRTYLLSLNISGSGKLNHLALRFVTAAAQSAAFERISSALTEDELYIYKRGRNQNGIRAPKSASASDYRRATGFEALFGWLELNGSFDRKRELFNLAYSSVMSELENELKTKGTISC